MTHPCRALRAPFPTRHPLSHPFRRRPDRGTGVKQGLGNAPWPTRHASTWPGAAFHERSHPSTATCAGITKAQASCDSPFEERPMSWFDPCCPLVVSAGRCTHPRSGNAGGRRAVPPHDPRGRMTHSGFLEAKEPRAPGGRNDRLPAVTDLVRGRKDIGPTAGAQRRGCLASPVAVRDGPGNPDAVVARVVKGELRSRRGSHEPLEGPRGHARIAVAGGSA